MRTPRGDISPTASDTDLYTHLVNEYKSPVYNNEFISNFAFYNVIHCVIIMTVPVCALTVRKGAAEAEDN